jgi:pimeloyl-ACP methyl ester carboxylesterase
MNDTHPCDPAACTMNCSTPCGGHEPGQPVTLSEALDRFQREATTGVCDTGRYRARYSTWGSGPPLVFIHGLADSSQAFLLPTALLSRSFRCIAYDLPCGNGDGADLARCTHPDLVADLWALLDHLGIAQSYLFTSGFGTTVGLAALRDRPERLPRAILQAPVAHRPLRFIERVALWMMSHSSRTLAGLPLWRRLMQEMHAPVFATRPSEFWEHFLGYSGALPACALGRLGRLLHRLDLRPDLAAIRQPVLLVCGDRDPITRPETAQAILGALPNAGLFILEGCGHVPGFTHPELLAEAIRFFLTPPKPDSEPAGRVPIGDCQVRG